jgi:DeoR/GlpR family transcriptional regulator of sugar metabolism
MIRAERRVKILEVIRENGFAEVRKLQELLNVTPLTIRRDLNALSKQNLIKKTYGGAELIVEEGTSVEPLYETKLYSNLNKKQAIGKAAIEYISDGDTLIIDNGTTTFQMVLNMRTRNFKNLTILVNDIKIAQELCRIKNLKVILIGGMVNSQHYSTYGIYASNILSEIKSNKVFLGIDGLSMENGISCSSLDDGPLKRLMIQSSKEKIVLADSSKFDKDVFYRICGWDMIDMIITDDGIPREYIDFCKDKNITLRVSELNLALSANSAP